jgi:hypothetical protein
MNYIGKFYFATKTKQYVFIVGRQRKYYTIRVLDWSERFITTIQVLMAHTLIKNRLWSPITDKAEIAQLLLKGL